MTHYDGSTTTTTPLQATLHALIDFSAGCAGGAASVLSTQPLDTVKVKMQTFPDLYTGMLSCARDTFRQQGVRGLYAGTTPNLAAQVAENSTLFLFYGLAQKALARHSGDELGPLGKATCGSAAAFFVSLGVTPAELLKCRLQSAEEARSLGVKMAPEGRITVTSISKEIWKTERLGGFYRGLSSMLAREVPGYFFFFGAYELSKHYLTVNRRSDVVWWPTILCGGLAGVAFWTAVFPTDVVKSRIQTGMSDLGLVGTLRHVAKTEGLFALYNGLVPTLLRTMPATGAMFLAFEWSKSLLESLI